jgi:hypothetical protein
MYEFNDPGRGLDAVVQSLNSTLRAIEPDTVRT